MVSPCGSDPSCLPALCCIKRKKGVSICIGFHLFEDNSRESFVYWIKFSHFGGVRLWRGSSPFNSTFGKLHSPTFFENFLRICIFQKLLWINSLTHQICCKSKNLYFLCNFSDIFPLFLIFKVLPTFFFNKKIIFV